MAPSVKGTIESLNYINISFLKETKDLTKPIIIPDSNYRIITPNGEDTTEYRKDLETLIKESSGNTITCYNDGSQTESGVGTGFLTTDNKSPLNIINNSYFKLPEFCSVFQAEVTAIRKVTTKTVTQPTDSFSTLQALSAKLSSMS